MSGHFGEGDPLCLPSPRPVLTPLGTAQVNQSAAELLIALSITSDANTKSQCALALGYLSELTRVKNGIVASMLLLSLNLEDKIDVATRSIESLLFLFFCSCTVYL